MPRPETEAIDRDERLGEAIEAYLDLAEHGEAPEPERFAADYPDLGGELVEALEGLALVQGLVGDPGVGPHRLEAGRRVAGYRIVGELGRGGMGVVYEAVHVDLDRPVALKVLGARAAPDSQGRRRFLNEAKTAAGLHHTHIVPVFDVGQVGGLCYYAMQRIEGVGLDRVVKALRRGRSTAAGSGSNRRSSAPPTPPAPPSLADTASWAAGMPPRSTDRDLVEREEDHPPFAPPRGSAYYRWVAHIGRQAAEALDHAHQSGVVHRDIKPSNLLVDAVGNAWVADFGLARRLADVSLTQTDSLLGTPRYMSPEQARGEAVGGLSDVFSLGATLYELVALSPPFDGKTAAELVRQIGEREVTPPRRHDPRLPRDLETIILKALARRPADRYATAGALAEDLKRFIDHEPVRARRIGPVGRLLRFSQRHPTLAAVALGSAVAIVSTVAVSYGRVVAERDRAVEAIRGMQLSQASLIRTSGKPDRREEGMNLVRAAAGSGPSPSQRAGLRDEAVELLALRDLVSRPEPIPTGKLYSLATALGGRRLAAITADGGELRLWAPGGREPIRPHQPLRTSAADTEGEALLPADVPMYMPRVAAAGPMLAALWPNGRGIRLFDATNGGWLADLRLPELQAVGLYAVPGLDRFVTVDRRVDPSEGPAGPTSPPTISVHLWDPTRMGEPLATLAETRGAAGGRPQGPPPPLVAVAADGSTIATARRGDGPPSGDRRGEAPTAEITLHDPRDGVPRRGAIKLAGATTALALGPGGRLAVAGGGTIALYQVDHPERPARNLAQHEGFVRLLRYSGDDRPLLAIAGGMGPGVEVWDPAAGELIATIPTGERAQDLAFAEAGPQGHTLMVAAADKLTTWSVAEPTEVVRLAAPVDGRPSALAFAPDGRLAASYTGHGRGAGLLWDPRAGPAATWEGGHLFALGFAAGRPVKAQDGRLYWDAAAGPDEPRRPDRPRGDGGPRPDRPPGSGRPTFGQSLAVGAGGRALAMARGTDLLIWRAEVPGRTLLVAPPEGEVIPPGRPWFCRGLAVTDAADRLYLLGSEGDLHAWRLDPGARASKLALAPLPTPRSTSLALSPDGRTLAVGSTDGTVTLLDALAPTRPRTLPIPLRSTPESATALAISPDGRTLAVAGSEGPVHLWGLAADAPTPLLRLPGHRGPATALAFAPEGRRLAAADEKGVQVWDLAKLRERLDGLGLGW